MITFRCKDSKHELCMRKYSLFDGSAYKIRDLTIFLKVKIMQWSKSDRNSHSINGGGETWSFSVINYKFYQNSAFLQKGTSRQRSGKGAIRKRFPLQKPRWEKTKLTIRHPHHETYRKPNEQLFSQ